MKTMSKSLFVGAAGALAVGMPLVAQAESPHSFSANVALTTEYMYRGISQTDGAPAVQGGFDYSYDSNTFADPYVGIWASNISFGGSVEADYYGGLAGEFSNGIGWDIGGLYYDYPAASPAGETFDFFEAYGSLSYTFPGEFEPTVGIGYAYSPDFFGETGTGHWFNPSFGLSLPHGVGFSASYGYQDVEDIGSYSTFTIGLSKDVGMFGLALDWVDTFDEDDFCTGIENLCDGRVVFTVSSSF